MRERGGEERDGEEEEGRGGGRGKRKKEKERRGKMHTNNEECYGKDYSNDQASIVRLVFSNEN